MGDKHEMMTSWHGTGRPHVVTWSERTQQRLFGSAKGRRRVPAFRLFDLVDQPNKEIVLAENDDQQIGVEAVVGAQADFVRYIDFDVLYFQFAGVSTIETEYGVHEVHPGEVILIPEGIAHRSSGDSDNLRYYVKLHEPVTEMHDASKEVSQTEFTVVRHGGPDWKAASGTAPKGKVVERMITWGEAPEDITLVEREYEDLVGVSSASRREAVSGIKKVRMFDVFAYATGAGHGPGPKIIISKHFMAEVYNTHGDQNAFHRGLRSEEMGIQFRGTATNMSEFDAATFTPPGLTTILPLGIAHSVRDCDEEFLRVVLYSDLKWRYPTDLTRHAFESTFEVKSKLVKAADWQKPAAK